MRRAWPVALLVVLIAGCATAPGRTNGDTRAAILAAARAQLGVPYHFGGASPREGFDCSGLIHYSYRRAGRIVPRTVAKLRARATPLPRARLAPADLLFFHSPYKSGHVGLYLGNGRFIHAPSSDGRVRIDRLDNPYWRRHFSAGGRLLPDSP